LWDKTKNKTKEFGHGGTGGTRPNTQGLFIGPREKESGAAGPKESISMASIAYKGVGERKSGLARVCWGARIDGLGPLAGNHPSSFSIRHGADKKNTAAANNQWREGGGGERPKKPRKAARPMDAFVSGGGGTGREKWGWGKNGAHRETLPFA